MKSVIIAVCVIACAYATSVDQDAKIVRSENEHNAEGGNFHYSFESDNGIAAQADGKVKDLGKDEVALEITGSNQFQSPDGQVFQLTYIANENGYQPSGDHLPTPPPPQPIPDYILRSIEYIAAHPYKEKV